MTLKEHRLKAGKTLRQLGDEARVSFSAIAYYEKGQRNPRYPTKAALALALGVSEHDIDWDAGR